MTSKILKRIFKIVCVLIIFLLIAYTNGTNRYISGPENLVGSIILWPLRAIADGMHNVAGTENSSNDMDIYDYNILLSEENNKLREKLADYELLKQENNLYKAELTAKSAFTDYDVIICNIIADSTSNWERVYTIDKGEDYGIQLQMPVVTSDGLVGFVTSVSANSSKIIAITDPTVSISSRNSRTRDKVVCRGLIDEENKMKISSIPLGATFSSGDKVETSGLGGIFPKGITIGTITQIDTASNPLETTATLTTAVDFNKLETVAIISNAQDDNLNANNDDVVKEAAE